jgi:hypothetical protein
MSIISFDEISMDNLLGITIVITPFGHSCKLPSFSCNEPHFGLKIMVNLRLSKCTLQMNENEPQSLQFGHSRKLPSFSCNGPRFGLKITVNLRLLKRTLQTNENEPRSLLMGLIGPLLVLLLLTDTSLLLLPLTGPLLLLLLPAIQHTINAFKSKCYTTLALPTLKFANGSASHFDKFNMLLGIELRPKRGLVGPVYLLKRRLIILLRGYVLQRAIDVCHGSKYQ